jgi:branched-chain amino acid aminotransferase
MMERESWIWGSGTGEPVPAGEATLSALDRSFLVGEGIYETLRTYHSRPFALDAHLRRLLRGAESWGYPPVDTGDLEEAIEDLTLRRAPVESAIRITLSRGTPHPWAGPEEWGQPAWTVFVGALPPHVPAYYERGVRCILGSRVRWNPGGFIPAVKFTGNPEMLLARREAKAAGAFEAILLNPSGLVAEGASSNLFLVKNRRLVTPALSAGILDGVTRSIVLNLAEGHGIPVEEREVAPWELLQAEEAFLTSTLKEIMPVVGIGEAVLGTGEPGKITDYLLGAYQEQCLEASIRHAPLELAGA